MDSHHEQPLSWIQELYRQSPVIAILVLVIVTGFYQIWVFGSAYKEMRQERDEYRKLAFDELHELEKAAVAQPTPWERRYRESPVPTPTVDPSPLKQKLRELEDRKRP